MLPTPLSYRITKGRTCRILAFVLTCLSLKTKAFFFSNNTCGHIRSKSSCKLYRLNRARFANELFNNSQSKSRISKLAVIDMSGRGASVRVSSSSYLHSQLACLTVRSRHGGNHQTTTLIQILVLFVETLPIIYCRSCASNVQLTYKASLTLNLKSSTNGNRVNYFLLQSKVRQIKCRDIRPSCLYLSDVIIIMVNFQGMLMMEAWWSKMKLIRY